MGELGGQLFELLAGRFHVVVRHEDLAGLAKGESVPVQQLLQLDRQGAQPHRLGRRPPFPPDVVQVVFEEVLDDHRQVGLQGALALVLSDDCVVALDDFDLDRGDELLGVLPAEAVTPAGVGGRPLDVGEVGEEEILGGVRHSL